jgi:hypothetical protein
MVRRRAQHIQVQVEFESSRLADHCWVDAYAHILPETRSNRAAENPKQPTQVPKKEARA